LKIETNQVILNSGKKENKRKRPVKTLKAFSNQKSSDSKDFEHSNETWFSYLILRVVTQTPISKGFTLIYSIQGFTRQHVCYDHKCQSWHGTIIEKT